MMERRLNMAAIWCLMMLLLCGSAMCQHQQHMLAENLTETDALLFKPAKTDAEKGSQYYRILHVEKTFMLVGGRNFYYNVSTMKPIVYQEYSWQPSEAHLSYCQSEIVKFGQDCNSYVVSAMKESDSTYAICASSAKKAQCRKLKQNAEGKWPVATEVDEIVPHRLVPLFPWHGYRKLTTAEGALHVVSDYLADDAVWCPQFFRDNVYNETGGVVKGGLRSECSESLFKVDHTAQKPPTYSNIFETHNFVYFTYTEPALETFNSIGSERSTYSRIARVCKNDKGRGANFPGDKDAPFKFATLFKARMVCGTPRVLVPGTNNKFMQEEYRGFYANYVNEIADASSPHISSVTGTDGKEIILAIFNSARNSVPTSAICAYKVEDLNRLFDTAVDQVTFDSELRPKLHVASRPPAKCYTDSEVMDEEGREAVNKYLLKDVVHPLNNNALFISDVEYRMTKMQVDWQVEANDGKKYDVLFVSTDDGRLLKFVNFAKPGESMQYHLVEKRQIFPGKEIHEMRLITDVTGKKHLLLNTLDQIKRVSLEKCHFYTDCSSCIGLRDPYCSWSPSLSKCVSTTHSVSDKYQNISSGVSSQCKDPVKNTTTTTETATASIELKRGETGAIQDRSNAGQEVNLTPFIVAIIILPLVIGAAAFLAGFFYSKKRYTSPTPHLDQELTNKCKDDKGDDYSLPPSKQINIQLMNNHFNGKCPNAETASTGERTLTRQKQVYV